MFSERPYSHQCFQLTVTHTCLAAIESWNLYTVPAGYDLFLDLATAQNGTTSTGLLTFIHTFNAVVYRMGGLVNFTQYIAIPISSKIYIPSGAVVSCSVRGITINDIVNVSLFGTLMVAGQWL